MLLELFERTCVDYIHQKTAIKLLSPGGKKNLAKNPSSMSLPDDSFKAKSAVSWSRHGLYYVLLRDERDGSSFIYPNTLSVLL